ncbi:phosphopantetheine-binding protein [Actinomadura sp. ATCC 31491]|uniref:Phosphopantetheine-binding protein n=1 Tax=Actinomadura luzonensis TaxID=2805427 RepID=A0ABT0GA33_9ACTN|nr:phosphopantetheine-binding protein [Actinomadura luzonensis]MCK2221085.1 phosphopantetheine-binding protein [Actinomadura luzonensis]
MSEFTIGDLVQALRTFAGLDEDVDLTGDIMDTPFESLGYDSLALFNTINSIERDHDIALGDDLTVLDTPRTLIKAVNDRLG